MKTLTNNDFWVAQCDLNLHEELSQLIEKLSHTNQSQHAERLLRLARVLNSRGLDPASMLEHALSQLDHIRGDRGALSQYELLILGDGEALPLATDQEILHARATRQQRFQKALHESLSTMQVAETLNVNSEKVLQLAAAGKLFSIGPDQARRFPEFQFTPTGILPHLDKFLYAMEGWHPLTIIQFFTVPDPDLTMGTEQSISAAEWLAKGGDVATVRAMLEGR
ncbi:hypothetical protein [Microbulbifer sp. HZ11]|uniref:hypothetical protein n=1 Tax=Microbulbifer sp. HZ11 TaxID=1453501 RepID=UPI00068FE020|nr:hypothetical protein [Microbulbifer sp. HZ11]